MKNLLWNGAVVVCAALVASCSNSEQQTDYETAAEAAGGSSSDGEVDANSPAAPASPSTPNLERAKLYRYSEAGAGSSDCKTGLPPGLTPNDVRCVGAAEWKWLCENARLIGKDAAKSVVASVAFDEGADAYEALEFLIDNQQIANDTIKWSSDGKESCKISFDIAGNYGGSYHSISARGYATDILLNPQGVSFIYNASKIYDF